MSWMWQLQKGVLLVSNFLCSDSLPHRPPFQSITKFYGDFQWIAWDDSFWRNWPRFCVSLPFKWWDLSWTSWRALNWLGSILYFPPSPSFGPPASMPLSPLLRWKCDSFIDALLCVLITSQCICYRGLWAQFLRFRALCTKSWESTYCKTKPHWRQLLMICIQHHHIKIMHLAEGSTKTVWVP